MPAQNWREVYELALLELDTSKLPGRVEAALRAIQQRLWQKKETLTRKEREERPTRHPNDSSGYVPVVELDFLRGVITCQQPSMAGALARESLPHFSLMRGIAS